ncbi:GTP pyrophosphokinase [Hyunsoonleella ulvae]|uniref:GTP pyrophosphokinase n=2 Tax=Flavobacteriaceae TaxID=49546 RepID=UPI0019394840|nr:hypothetical protein [Hyunsoonleella ulvae]
MKKKELQEFIKKHKPYTGMLYELLKSLLESNSVKYHIVEKRTKTLESLEEKIERKNINDVSSDILDISGIRIIIYYDDDLDIVEKIINKNFKVDKNNSINKQKIYDSNEFGYLSRHYIVKVNNKRAELEEWQRFNSLNAEIQVRTVLQHSWASISHELYYKKNYDIPKELNRKLFRLAGLFELADEQFLEIRNKHENLENQINSLNSIELGKEKINLLTLNNRISQQEGIFNEIKNIGIESGFNYNSIIDDTYVSNIILISKYLQINNISELEQLLENNKADIKMFFDEVISVDGKDKYWGADIPFLVMMSLLLNLNEEQLEQFSTKVNWNNSIWDKTKKSILKIKNYS